MEAENDHWMGLLWVFKQEQFLQLFLLQILQMKLYCMISKSRLHQRRSGEVQSKCCGKGTCKEIPAIGSYSNFSFEEGGIHVWKDHGIGEGLLIKNDQIPAINIRYITVLKEPDDITFHQLPKRNTNQTQKI
ncbi:Hypothetical predicted protein [Mytilus galloprovincialis]|uniref:Uncharacterized protein n=1 Tax=Mytilus galloprovincialis TaxID=29158 RepID=A0A8B6BN76_MYTGA|nr:Hypothetical predicted protein [Mytilus galloprovincialis]